MFIGLINNEHFRFGYKSEISLNSALDDKMRFSPQRKKCRLIVKS